MLVPKLRSWVEERRDFIINGVQRGDFRAFVFVAFEAGERQVDEDRCAVVFARDDVIYLMGKIRIVLMQQTVFANVFGSGDDQPTKPRGDFD